MDGWDHLRGLKLSDPNFGNPGYIDLLIGADVWGLIVKDGFINGNANEPHAQNTHLGWVISGPVDLFHCNLARSLHMRANQELELTRIWQLEEPIGAEGDSQLVDKCEKHYISTVKRQADGRYVVDIPFFADDPGSATHAEWQRNSSTGWSDVSIQTQHCWRNMSRLCANTSRWDTWHYTKAIREKAHTHTAYHIMQ